MYLIRNYWQSLSDKFTYLSLDEFYDLEKVVIDKINLINISNELNIPKETIRRKVNELQESGILISEGKSIMFNKRGINYQKPEKTLELLSHFIEKKSRQIGSGCPKSCKSQGREVSKQTLHLLFYPKV